MKKKPAVQIFTPANAVTIGRIILLILLAIILPPKSVWLRVLCVSTVPILFALDSVDGYIARHFRCSTRLGGVLDIAGDRIVENALWILLATFQFVPLWIPLIILSRGFLTDGIRSVALAKGHSTFSMIRSKTSWWLVASPASRTSYAVLKAVLFTMGVSIHCFNFHHLTTLIILFYVILSLTIFQCLLRGYFTVKECLHSL